MQDDDSSGEKRFCTLPQCGLDLPLEEQRREREIAGEFHSRRIHGQRSANGESHRRETELARVAVPVLAQIADLVGELGFHLAEQCLDALERFILREAVRDRHVELCHCLSPFLVVGVLFLSQNSSMNPALS